MLVASDTSPISNLAIIGRLDLLRTQFREIWIPPAVESELGALPHPPALASIHQAFRDGWIKPRTVQGDRIIRLLGCDLDRGEAEAIALGVELPADLILLDEREGRCAARRVGLRVSGVLGVLLCAKARGQISLVRPELEALRSRARFFIAPRLEEEVLRLAGE
jgi:predicted nucleic acid-binding protein